MAELDHFKVHEFPVDIDLAYGAAVLVGVGDFDPDVAAEDHIGQSVPGSAAALLGGFRRIDAVKPDFVFGVAFRSEQGGGVAVVDLNDLAFQDFPGLCFAFRRGAAGQEGAHGAGQEALHLKQPDSDRVEPVEVEKQPPQQNQESHEKIVADTPDAGERSGSHHSHFR